MSHAHVNDEVKAYLSLYLEGQTEIRRMRARIKELEAQACATTKPLTGMPRGGGADEGRLLAILADAKTEFTDTMWRLLRREKEIEDFIASLQTMESRVILKLRYLEGMSWNMINQEFEALGKWVTDRQLYRMHGKALAEAREEYNKRRTENDKRADT